MRVIRSSIVLAVVFAAGLAVGQFSRADLAAQPAPGQNVYELRTYHTHPGKLADLNTRFRDHTTRIFEKHGMTNIGYWVPQDEPAHASTLSRTPAKRWGHIDDLAGTPVFLSSSASDFVTGTAIPVDGGYSVQG